MKIIYYLLGLVGLIIIILFALRCDNNGRQPLVGNDSDEHGCIASAGYSWCNLNQKCIRSWEEACIADINSSTPIEDGNPASFSSEALVLSPKQNEIVSSPLKVQGQALGTWFFEASLPVKLIDESGNLIAAHYATAATDWMTEKPVVFNSEIIFQTAATSGYLIISKDNPSGLPENDGSISVPIRFK